MEIEPEELRWSGGFTPELYELLRSLGFNRFIERWGLAPQGGAEAAKAGGKRGQQGRPCRCWRAPGAADIRQAVEAAEYIALCAGEGLDELTICDGKAMYTSRWAEDGEGHREVLAAVFSPRVKKVARDVKDLMRLLQDEGLSTEGFVFDTALAGYVLDPTESGYDTARLAARHLGAELPEAQALWELYPVMDSALDAAGGRALYHDIELPLCSVLARMEEKGFLVDRKALAAFGEGLAGGIERLQRSIWEHAGHEFNINSPKQLGEVLFEELMLPAGKKTKTGWSTNADVLEKLVGKHPIISEILDYRMLTKLKSTYADGLLKVISPDGRIHTSFRMTVTATGASPAPSPTCRTYPCGASWAGR